MDKTPEDCIFCNIINKKINSDIVFEDEQFIVARDILPQAPVHLLIMPKLHIASLNDLQNDQSKIMGDMIMLARDEAIKQGISDRGYKIVLNVGKDGDQGVKHINIHLLGGKALPSF